MTITIHSTSKMVTANGVPARVWEGATATGIKVAVLVARVAGPDNPLDQWEFEAELQEHEAPTALSEAFPLRMIL